ncbi:hypothetical protein [Aquibaculum arenosum]|uniref:Lipoprotein n=1 Tax=Aquibaculum arenosum TaxID=3032591 RepID=A0ABT5YNL3_9PROT|nr:hypothetical protein [Fodinicurvata sp. CAU 1616]MDF2096544.1 hypothetical protein [Fodinicurvata sp. CAU 1616]
MMQSLRTFGVLVSLAVAGVLLSACDPEEQDRVLLYEKGTYLGQADEELSPEARQELRNRARYQRGL